MTYRIPTEFVDVGVQAGEVEIANFFPGFYLVKQGTTISPPPRRKSPLDLEGDGTCFPDV